MKFKNGYNFQYWKEYFELKNVDDPNWLFSHLYYIVIYLFIKYIASKISMCCGGI
jgi:hypothetical protein